MTKPELLAPAGDLERLKWAIDYGADAVYFGGPGFGLRANAINFTFDDIAEAVKYAHDREKRVYVTVNIVLHDKEANELEEYLKKLESLGVDAIIVSDPAVIKLAHEKTSLEIHLSTQQSTLNKKAVEFFKKEGVTRIVLGRETSKEEIKEIIDKTDVDIETFIHGAMCTCFSGRCALSNYVTNRDANRGGCAQVCRFSFDTNESKEFTMALKDMNMAEYIGDLIDIGVTSLKVEGRMRSHYYLATVMSSYRKIIDACYDNKLTDEFIMEQEKILARVANRETSTHYFTHLADESDQYYTGRQELSNQDYLAYCLDYDKENKILTVSERNYFEPGDNVEIFMPGGKVISLVIDEIYDEDMNLLDKACHPEQILKLKVDTYIEESSMIRKKV